MAAILHDGPGTRIPPRLAHAAQAFLAAQGGAFDRALRRCPNVLIAADRGGIVAVVAWHLHTLLPGDVPIDCVYVERAAFGPAWSRHPCLLSRLADTLAGRRGRDRVLFWAADPEARCPPAIARLLAGADPAPSGPLHAVRDRLLTRIAPQRWDPVHAVVRDPRTADRGRHPLGARTVRIVPVTPRARLVARAMVVAAILQTPVRLPAPAPALAGPSGAYSR